MPYRKTDWLLLQKRNPMGVHMRGMEVIAVLESFKAFLLDEAARNIKTVPTARSSIFHKAIDDSGPEILRSKLVAYHSNLITREEGSPVEVRWENRTAEDELVDFYVLMLQETVR